MFTFRLKFRNVFFSCSRKNYGVLCDFPTDNYLSYLQLFITCNWLACNQVWKRRKCNPFNNLSFLILQKILWSIPSKNCNDSKPKILLFLPKPIFPLFTAINLDNLTLFHVSLIRFYPIRRNQWSWINFGAVD